MPSLIEITRAAQTAGVPLTPQAALLAKVVLDAIAEDPHPRWRNKKTSWGDGGDPPRLLELNNIQMRITADLPGIFKEVQQHESDSIGEVSTFDLLHWLTKRLDTICPFDK